MADLPTLPTSGKRTRFALILGGAVPLITIGLSLRFFWVPPGSHIRPMGWPVLLIMLSVYGLLFVLPAALVAYYFERRALPALLAVVLSLTAWPLGVWLIRFASEAVGFALSP